MKERFEWIQSWCDETDKTDLPRVLTVGDSISLGYYEGLKKQLEGIAYVDNISLSYAVDTEFYQKTVLGFIEDSKYAVIHINHGLHGKHMDKATYKEQLEKLLCEIAKQGKVILATTTHVNKAWSEETDETWQDKIAERNEAMSELAEKYGFAVDRLFEVSKGVEQKDRSEDGVHYKEGGSLLLAQAVAQSIKKIL